MKKCISCVSVAMTECSNKGSFGEKGFILAYHSRGDMTMMVEKAWQQEGGVPDGQEED